MPHKLITPHTNFKCDKGCCHLESPTGPTEQIICKSARLTLMYISAGNDCGEGGRPEGKRAYIIRTADS